MYFPGTTTAASAGTITVGLGEEKPGIDFQLQLVPTATIEGRISGLDSGAPVTVQLVSEDNQPTGLGGLAPSIADGRFTFTDVVPGRYRIQARSPQRDATGAPPDTSLLRVSLAPEAGGRGVGPLGTVGGRGGRGAGSPQVDSSGRLTIRGVVPGTYTLRVDGPGGWSAKSVMTGSRDALDFGLELGTDAAPTDLVVTLTNRSTDVRGTLRDANGRPTSDATIVAFATQAQYWRPRARRIQATRPGSDGAFSIHGLPAGDYLIVAVADIETGAWYRSTLLARLKSMATALDLGDGDEKVQDLRVTGGARGFGAAPTASGDAARYPMQMLRSRCCLLRRQPIQIQVFATGALCLFEC